MILLKMILGLITANEEGLSEPIALPVNVGVDEEAVMEAAPVAAAIPPVPKPAFPVTPVPVTVIVGVLTVPEGVNWGS